MFFLHFSDSIKVLGNISQVLFMFFWYKGSNNICKFSPESFILWKNLPSTVYCWCRKMTDSLPLNQWSYSVQLLFPPWCFHSMHSITFCFLQWQSGFCTARLFFSLVLESQYTCKMKYVCTRTLLAPEGLVGKLIPPAEILKKQYGQFRPLYLRTSEESLEPVIFRYKVLTWYLGIM